MKLRKDKSKPNVSITVIGGDMNKKNSVVKNHDQKQSQTDDNSSNSIDSNFNNKKTLKHFNKKHLLIIIVVAVSLAVGFYFYTNNKGTISVDELATYGEYDVEDLTPEQQKEIANKDIDPKDNPEAAEAQAKTLDILGDTNKATEKYKSIVEANPTVDSYEQYATALARNGDWNGGIVVLEEGISFVESNTNYSAQEKTLYIGKLENRKYAFEQEINNR